MSIRIRPLEESEILEADTIHRVAFGTLYRVPDPTKFGGDTDRIGARFHADNTITVAAEANGKLIGSNVVMRWGAFGLFGPLTVHPDYWNQGAAKSMVEHALKTFSDWNIRYSAFFTTIATPKNVALYQRYDYWPRFLSMMMERPVGAEPAPEGMGLYSDLAESERVGVLEACREVSSGVLEGLDLGAEIRTVAERNYGDTVLVSDNGQLAAFAVCHCGSGTEAGGDLCRVKFGAVRSGANAGADFDRLIAACDALARDRGMGRLAAGSNAERLDSYRQLLKMGFRTEVQGVSMHGANHATFNHADAYVIDELR